MKQQKEASSDVDSRPWWEKIVGIYQNDPVFDEVERLGREWRDFSRPKDYE